MIKKLTLTTIGPRLEIALPRYDITGLPAKVDTGADSSAIWASQVYEADGLLSFVLFDKTSPFYSGQVITTKQYTITSVRNSFGRTEHRFKVRLKVMIEGRIINARFTLANRSENRYPVLIGRRTLQGKFLVDVAQARVHKAGKEPYRVLVLGSETPEKAFLQSVSSQTTRNVEFTARNLNQLAFWIETGNVSVYETATNQDIADFDLVYFKSHRRYYEFAIAAAEYLQFRRVRFLDEELRDYVAYDKLTELMRLALQNIPVPRTFCGSMQTLKQQAEMITTQLGYPFVCKEINADRSRKNYLLQTVAEITEISDDAEPKDMYLLQEYIQSNGYIRALVFGDEVALAIQKVATASADKRKAHLNTPSGGKNTKLLLAEQIPQLVAKLALQSAKAMHRQVAGADLIQDKRTAEWFVLEINGSPQIYSGAFVEEKRTAFAKFIDFQLDR